MKLEEIPRASMLLALVLVILAIGATDARRLSGMRMRQRRKDYAALRMSAVLAMHWSVRRKKTHVCVKRLMFAYERAFSAKYWSE